MKKEMGEPADLIPTPTGGQPGAAPMPGEGGGTDGQPALGQPTPDKVKQHLIKFAGEQQPPVPQDNGEAPPSDDRY